MAVARGLGAAQWGRLGSLPHGVLRLHTVASVACGFALPFRLACRPKPKGVANPQATSATFSNHSEPI